MQEEMGRAYEREHGVQHSGAAHSTDGRGHSDTGGGGGGGEGEGAAASASQRAPPRFEPQPQMEPAQQPARQLPPSVLNTQAPRHMDTRDHSSSFSTAGGGQATSAGNGGEEAAPYHNAGLGAAPPPQFGRTSGGVSMGGRSLDSERSTRIGINSYGASSGLGVAASSTEMTARRAGLCGLQSREYQDLG